MAGPALGAATLVVGHLSLFSVMFISIVIGIGIDYGIYFLFRYEEEDFLGRRLGALEFDAHAVLDPSVGKGFGEVHQCCIDRAADGQRTCALRDDGETLKRP